jgi:hypothetical protein
MRFDFESRGGTATDSRYIAEVAMVAITALVLLSTLATAFYVRFLIAIGKECKVQRICYLVRLQSDWDESATQADRTIEVPSLRAA